MPNLNSSLLSIEDLDLQTVQKIFQRASFFKNHYTDKSFWPNLRNWSEKSAPLVAQVYFEPSTRTRMSFEVASGRPGLPVVNLDNMVTSSVSKGETYFDTLKTVEAMSPDLLILRHHGDAQLEEAVTSLACPVINAGSGGRGHPTQALLDAFTIYEQRQSMESLKVLFIGDVFHSRVANSNYELLSLWNAEMAYCAPEQLRQSSPYWDQAQQFQSLQEGLAWCDVCMGLRVQTERHSRESSGSDAGFSIDAYKKQYMITGDKLKVLKSEGLFLHPGPSIRGVDIGDEVFEDSRCQIRRQVTNGVYVRAAIISLILGLNVEEE